MLDDVQRLHDNFHLAVLLSHYAALGKEDRTVWQDRLMHMDGIEEKELSKLHGELIAWDWIEQNTGHATVANGVVCSCYRITPAGIRDLARFRGEKVQEQPPEMPAKTFPKRPRKRKQKDATPDLAESGSMDS